MFEQRSAKRSYRVAICVATFRRMEALQALLDALVQIRFKKVPEPSLQILVIDNDAAQSALPVCRLARLPWPVHYFCEPQRGIVFARNRAIEFAAGSDFLVFIDDDELPAPQWLDELLWTQSTFEADVVSGTLIPAFSAEIPNWIRNGKFFERPVFTTGSPVQMCSSGNVLIRSGVFATVPGFDEQFNLSGGEDTHFFLRVREAGLRMVFSKEAVVYEPISAQRANFFWLLKRGFQAGNSWAYCERSLKPGWRTRILRVAKEFVHIGRGVLQCFAAVFAGKAHLVRSLQTISAGIGTMAGVVGYRFLAYGNMQDPGALGKTPVEQVPAKLGLGRLP